MDTSTMTKNWWESKTIWFNVLTALGEITALYLDPSVVTPQTIVLVGLVHSIVNIGLRYVSNTPIQPIAKMGV